LTPDSGLDETAPGPDESYGLFQLYDPPQGIVRSHSNASYDTRVDIVAIHGINGDARQTWTHGNGKCWLKDFLPETHSEARIYTFGYPAGVAFSRSFAKIEDFARRLLIDLTAVRVTDTVNLVIARCVGPPKSIERG
jgi:hypothetical protein